MTIRRCVPAVALAAATVLAAWSAGAEPRCRDVLAYLKADAEDRKGWVQRWDRPPVVTAALPLCQGQTVEDWTAAKADAEWAVWFLNKHLPNDWQLRYDSRPALSGYGAGEIRVVYLHKKAWAERIRSGTDLAKAFDRTVRGKMEFAIVLLDRTRLMKQHERHHVLLHELLHTLGRGHVDQGKFPETIMHPKADRNRLVYLREIDKAALAAVYSPLVPVGAKGKELRCDPQGRIIAKARGKPRRKR